jgi:hypothetical protein
MDDAKQASKKLPLTGELASVKDIYELIRQRETEIDRLDKEIGRIEKELEALRLTARLLDEIPEAANRPVAASISPVAREIVEQSVTPVARTATTAGPVPTVGAWASAKQFP